MKVTSGKIWYNSDGSLLLCDVCAEKEEGATPIEDSLELQALAEDNEDLTLVCDLCGEILYDGRL